MKLFMLSLLLIVACSNTDGTTTSPTFAQPTPVPNCTVVQTNSNVTISCENGSVTFPLGTVITIVQFCPGDTNYPSEFDEIGFCINNNIYAVYSVNDGFLSLVPPGVYSSNGIDASCTFTITANCGIINQ
jgi:hypothetical protein